MLQVRLRILFWVSAVAVVSTGCRVSPWSAPNVAPMAPRATTSPVSTAIDPSPTAAADGQPADGGLQDVMAEVRRLAADDPALETQLLGELQRSDPSLWPLVVESFRARVAYGRQLRQEEALAARPVEPRPALAHDASHVGAAGTAGAWPAGMPANSEPAVARLPVIDQSILTPGPLEPGLAGSEPQHVGWAPPTNTQQLAVGSAHPTINSQPPKGPELGRETSVANPSVFNAPAVPPTDNNAPPDDDWRALLDQTIGLLDARLKQEPAGERLAGDHVRLRLLELAAGRRATDSIPIPGSDPSWTRFWTSELAALHVMLEPGEDSGGGLPLVEARRHLREAADSLGVVAPLEIRNLAFCRAVESFGSIKRFEKDEFGPGQRVLLYAEIDNFRAERTAKGYHTSLRSGYQIFDAAGRPAAPRESTTTEDYCGSPRRDYFIGCDFHLPTSLQPGRHTLRLTVEDLKTGSVGEASIEFAITEN